MKVTSAATAANGQYISVELTEDDVSSYKIMSGDNNLAPEDKFSFMSGLADMMIVKHLYKAGVIPKEYASDRLKEISGRMREVTKKYEG